ncbi:hypothetical protein [Pseudooceanicola aestuarii]|uniref:hypothetical protein n=1 Tax=Pseudooceanicola aestuarii TaxID=2697319 RepID=UPI0013D44BC7|nr:hypothetical protein [Pseudooceanicola aestuarii]
MARNGWHILRDGAGVTLARHLPPRFDLEVRARIDTARDVSRLAVARQLRQDMWRLLRDLRGFSPVVEVTSDDAGLALRAGGRIIRRDPAAAARLAALMSSPAHHARWLAHAGRQRHV